ncbi:MAG: hypothetical protein ACLR4A_11365 [Christensenellales bacterium]
MSSLSAVLSARAALSDLTPLLTDCGRLCGFACCKGDEQTGMLLFPGEEALFAPCAFGRVIPAHFELAGRPAHLFVCNGTCSRETARWPAACFRFSCISKKTARRASNSTSAKAVCPLCDYGVIGLRTEFVAAAKPPMPL